MKKIKLLIVDDSALVRNILAQGLSQDPEIDVIATARDPFDARDKILKLKPDVLTLDVEMPRMDGVEFLRKLMPQFPLPVIMVSALTERGGAITLEALEVGAVDFVTKPSVGISQGLNSMLNILAKKIKTAAKIDVSNYKKKKGQANTATTVITTKALVKSTDKVIAIGSSTGGTQALREVLPKFPRDMPGVIVVQHMPAGFTKMFAKRMNELCEMEVKEAESGDRILTGRILIAPGDYHMRIVRSGGIYKVSCQEGEAVNGHRPSVTELFNSVAKYAGANAVGVMLTGMGNDGAEAMLNMREAGARTLAQDEKTSVVFGMPKEAYDKGGAEKLVPIQDVSNEIIEMLNSME